MSEDNTQDNGIDDIILQTEEYLGQDLMAFIIQELKALPDVWQKLSKTQQDAVIDRMRARVDKVTIKAVSMISTRGFSKVIGVLDGVAIKDDIKATIKVARSNPGEEMQNLFEAHNDQVMIVVADLDQFTAGMDEIEGESDQKSLDVQTGLDDPLYDDAIAMVTQADVGSQVTISQLQRKLRIGYNRAARLIEQLEEDRYLSELQSGGFRTVLDTEEPEEAA